MRAWWYKNGPGKDTPWCNRIDDGPIADYNEAFIKQLRKDLGELAVGRTDDDVIRLFSDDQYERSERERIEKEAEIARRNASPEPWADLHYEGGKLVVKAYNPAFVNNLRQTLGDLVTEETPEAEVVKLFADRQNLEREEPRLEVLHLGIEEDGQLMIKLDWNKAFIDHLKKHGITGETEDEAIKEYLSRLTTENADNEGELPEFLSRDAINEAFKEMDVETAREFEEAEALVKKRKPRRRKMKGGEASGQ